MQNKSFLSRHSYHINSAGIVLTEALVAIGMMLSAAVILGGIVTSAASTTKTSKSYLIAQNLATEGMEGVKNIRDTNRLKFANDAECWLHGSGSDCSDATFAATRLKSNEEYLLSQDENGAWFLEPSSASGPLDLKTQSPASMVSYQLFLDNNGFYTSTPTTVPTPYYREIKFTSVGSKEAAVEVKIQWFEGANVRMIKRNLMIYN